MKNLIFYRIASYILLPVAAFMGFATLMLLLMALGNFAMLFSVFIAASTVIYIFASFAFLQKIDRQMACKPSLKDWIKVNGFVTLFFVANLLVSVGLSISNPAAMNQIIDSVMAAQAKNMQGIDAAMMQKTMKGVIYFMGVLALVLLFHVFCTFRLIKQYGALFGNGSK